MGMQLRSATAGLQPVGVELVGVLHHAVHVLHRKGDAGHAVIFEDGQADDHVAHAGEDLGELDVGCGAERDRLVFKSRNVRSEAANARGIGVDGEAAGLEVALIAIPDDDVAGLDAGPLQALGDGEGQHGVGRDAAAAEAIGLDADDFVLRAGREDLLPGFDGFIAASVGGDGAIEQGQGFGAVELAACAVQRGIAGDNDAGFTGFEMAGELIFVLWCGRHIGHAWQRRVSLRRWTNRAARRRSARSSENRDGLSWQSSLPAFRFASGEGGVDGL